MKSTGLALLCMSVAIFSYKVLLKPLKFYGKIKRYTVNSITPPETASFTDKMGLKDFHEKGKTPPGSRRYNPSTDSIRKSKYSPVKRMLRAAPIKIEERSPNPIDNQGEENNRIYQVGVTSYTDSMNILIDSATRGHITHACEIFYEIVSSSHEQVKLRDCNFFLKILGDGGHLDECGKVLSLMKMKKNQTICRHLWDSNKSMRIMAEKESCREIL